MAEANDKQSTPIERLAPFILLFLLMMLAIVGWWRDHPAVTPYYALFGESKRLGELYLFVTNLLSACWVSYSLPHTLKHRRAALEEADPARLSANSLQIS